MNFGKWDNSVHSTVDAEKRYKKAMSADLTPMSVDRELQKGIFKGSGKTPYEVTLDFCTCGDYKRRQLPCKHIYRLAMELNLIDGNYDTGINKNSLNEQLFSMPATAQKVLYDMCYEAAYHKQIAFVFGRTEYEMLLPLIANGFCIEALNNYTEVLSSVPAADFKKIYDILPFDDKPKLTAQKRTYINYLSAKENDVSLNNAIVVLQLNEQTAKQAHTIISRFRMKFIKKENAEPFDDDIFFYDNTEYEEVFNNEII